MGSIYTEIQKVSKGTLFEPIARIAEMPTTDKKRARTAIENILSKYTKMYPINNFEKAFAFSKLMLEENFAEFAMIYLFLCWKIAQRLIEHTGIKIEIN